MKIYLECAIVILVVITINVSGNLFCEKNERFSICGNNECRPTCKLPRGPKFCDPKCRPGCICLKGLVRREKDKKCVKVEECYNSQSSGNFQQSLSLCPPKKKQFPQRCPYKKQCPQRKRRFPQQGQVDVQEPHYPSGHALETGSNNSNKKKLQKKLQKEYEKALNKIKDLIEKGKGLKKDVVKKLKEIRDKMKKNNIEIEKKAKNLFEKIKNKAKDAEKKMLDKILGEDFLHPV